MNNNDFMLFDYDCYIQMRKKQQRKQTITIEFLQQKYQEEREILSKENKRLQKQINQQIQKNNRLTIELEQLHQMQDSECQSLKRENQLLKARIQELEKNQQSISGAFEEDELQSLRIQKELAIQNQKLEIEKQELEEIMSKIFEEKTTLENQVNQFKFKEEEMRKQMQNVARKHSLYKAEANQQISNLQADKQKLIEEQRKMSEKLSQQKKKKKDVEKKVEDMQKKLRISQEMEQRMQQEELEALRKERDDFVQKKTELQTKVHFLQANVKQKDEFIARIETDSQEIERKATLDRNQIMDYRIKIQKLQQQCHRLSEEYQLAHQDRQEEADKATKTIEESLKNMKKKMAEQLMSLIRDKDQELSCKNIQRYMDGVTNRQGNNFNQNNQLIESEDRIIDRLRMQSQINGLEGQLAQSRRQHQVLNAEMNRAKRALQQRQQECDKKQREIREYRDKLQKIQLERGRELMSLRNQNNMLRNVQTQKLQIRKEFQQYETAMGLKLAFYQRKIQEHLDTLDRKKSIIQKLKIAKSELEDRQKNYQDNYRKIHQEIDVLRKFRQDCARKDQLMRDYKSKLQKMKIEVEELKEELVQVKRDKFKYEKQLESKEQYLSTLKVRQDKQPERVDQAKQNQKIKQIKEIRNGYELKLKQMKKQKEELGGRLQFLHSIILNKVEETIARSIPVTGKKKTQDYQAAKLLGLKAGQLESFLNPSSAVNSSIQNQLQQQWQMGNYQQFIDTFTNYLSSNAIAH